MNGPLIKVLTFCGSKISLAGSPRTFSLLSVERATESDEKLTPLVEPWQSCRKFRRLSSSSLKKKGEKEEKISGDEDGIAESRKRRAKSHGGGDLECSSSTSRKEKFWLVSS